MLDSLVRVLRRVGWGTDQLRRNTVGHQREKIKAAPARRATGHARRACARLPENPPAPPRVHNRRRRVGSHRPLRTRAEEIGTIKKVRSPHKSIRPHSPLRRTGCGVLWRGRVHPGRTASWARGRHPHVRGAPSLASAEAEDTGPERPRHWTSRAHPFPSEQFHVLLNSLFKVLFNFPSRERLKRAAGRTGEWPCGGKAPPDTRDCSHGSGEFLSHLSRRVRTRRGQLTLRVWASYDPQTGEASSPGRPEAAMRVRKFGVQCVLQFTPIIAASCVLHRPVSRVIHCSELS
ncbi:hypothetical protein NPIL_163581 [Nephila pilipes]|uniref:Uncharacterized protein n=1 Tax=Nephila pilipes TaxID=299642 RepID=A0A8X6MS69_NEPPI|nr:hypothetical protein NPIL_163581 [Nephila pilipes]